MKLRRGGEGRVRMPDEQPFRYQHDRDTIADRIGDEAIGADKCSVNRLVDLSPARRMHETLLDRLVQSGHFRRFGQAEILMRFGTDQ